MWTFAWSAESSCNFHATSAAEICISPPCADGAASPLDLSNAARGFSIDWAADHGSRRDRTLQEMPPKNKTILGPPLVGAANFSGVKSTSCLGRNSGTNKTDTHTGSTEAVATLAAAKRPSPRGASSPQSYSCLPLAPLLCFEAPQWCARLVLPRLLQRTLCHTTSAADTERTNFSPSSYKAESAILSP